MPMSHDIKKGETYTCEVCGLTLQVIEQCKRFGVPDEDVTPGDKICDACGGAHQFEITCCGTVLKKKE